MSSSFHSGGERLPVNTHTDSSHLSYSERCLVELISPGIHLFLPLLEAFWNDLREIIGSSFWSLSNFPHESPFSVHHWIQWRNRLISLS